MAKKRMPQILGVQPTTPGERAVARATAAGPTDMMDVMQDRRGAPIKPPKKGKRKKKAPKAETTAFQGGDKWKNF
jgi:hypothetical protein